MNARMPGLFKFSTKTGAPEPSAPAKAPTRPDSQTTPDEAKAKIAEMIAEMAKPEARNPRATSHAVKQERRHRRRVKISAPVRVRQVDLPRASEFDLTMTSDVSREGILFETSRANYHRGQEVAVVFPYRAMLPGEQAAEQRGQVVRVVRASESRFGVAVAFLDGAPKYELIDSLGNPLGADSAHASESPAGRTGRKPLIIHVDADQRVRALVRTELELQGYSVESVQDPNLALTLFRHRAPVAVICESEPFSDVLPGGGEMSGYDLCVIIRRNAKFAQMPVILTTRSGLPSDFSTAHALGATVCVSKPYDLRRIINLVRMLAPAEAK
jgi:twitching motility two-component system response regulator PilG